MAGEGAMRWQRNIDLLTRIIKVVQFSLNLQNQS